MKEGVRRQQLLGGSSDGGLQRRGSTLQLRCAESKLAWDREIPSRREENGSRGRRRRGMVYGGAARVESYAENARNSVPLGERAEEPALRDVETIWRHVSSGWFFFPSQSRCCLQAVDSVAHGVPVPFGVVIMDFIRRCCYSSPSIHLAAAAGLRNPCAHRALPARALFLRFHAGPCCCWFRVFG
jgi:hypothetical protein